MKKSFERFNIVSFWELPEEIKVSDGLTEEENSEESFFLSLDDRIAWPLSLCMRTNGGRYHGVIGISNNSAIGAILSADGEQAVLKYL